MKNKVSGCTKKMASANISVWSRDGNMELSVIIKLLNKVMVQRWKYEIISYYITS